MLLGDGGLRTPSDHAQRWLHARMEGSSSAGTGMARTPPRFEDLRSSTRLRPAPSDFYPPVRRNRADPGSPSVRCRTPVVAKPSTRLCPCLTHVPSPERGTIVPFPRFTRAHARFVTRYRASRDFSSGRTRGLGSASKSPLAQKSRKRPPLELVRRPPRWPEGPPL